MSAFPVMPSRELAEVAARIAGGARPAEDARALAAILAETLRRLAAIEEAGGNARPRPSPVRAVRP